MSARRDAIRGARRAHAVEAPTAGPGGLLVINYEYPPIGGGGGVLCRDVAEALARRGWRVTVLTSMFSGLARYERRNGVAIHRVSVWSRNCRNTSSLASMLSYVPAALARGRRLLRAGGFQLLNTYFAVPSGPVGHLLARAFGLPNVLCILGGDVYDPSKRLSPHRTPLLHATVRRMIRGADRVVAESTDIRNKAVRFYDVDRPIDVIPIGFNPPRAVQAPPRRRDRFVLATVGRLVERKNLGELLDTFGRLRREVPSELIIVGDGPQREVLQAKAAALGLDGTVRFFGRVSEARKYRLLAGADVYVSTASHEGFGIVFLEAMQCGLPVVCYDEGGQVDFLRDGVTGYVLRLGDTDGFLSKLLALYRDPDRRRRIGDHNRRYVRRFYIDRCVERYQAVFSEVLGSVESPRRDYG